MYIFMEYCGKNLSLKIRHKTSCYAICQKLGIDGYEDV